MQDGNEAKKWSSSPWHGVVCLIVVVVIHLLVGSSGLQWYHLVLAAAVTTHAVLAFVFTPQAPPKWEDLPMLPDKILEHDYIVVGNLLCYLSDVAFFICVCIFDVLYAHHEAANL